MPKSKPTRTQRGDRTKRPQREPGQERTEPSRDSDGVIDEELDELDTDKYEPPPRHLLH